MADPWSARLREAGLRVTAARLAVLRAIDESDHSDADQIRGLVGDSLGAISGQAVYDALNVLTARGVLRRIEPAGRRARYEIDRGDNHHHIVCRGCGAMEDVACIGGSAPCLHPEIEQTGWTLDQAEVIYWGYCPRCASAAVGQSA